MFNVLSGFYCASASFVNATSVSCPDDTAALFRDSTALFQWKRGREKDPKQSLLLTILLANHGQLDIHLVVAKRKRKEASD